MVRESPGKSGGSGLGSCLHLGSSPACLRSRTYGLEAQAPNTGIQKHLSIQWPAVVGAIWPGGREVSSTSNHQLGSSAVCSGQGHVAWRQGGH